MKCSGSLVCAAEQRHEAVAVAVGQRLQHDRVDDAVDRRRRPDADRQRAGREDRDALRLPPRPPRLHEEHGGIMFRKEACRTRAGRRPYDRNARAAWMRCSIGGCVWNSHSVVADGRSSARFCAASRRMAETKASGRSVSASAKRSARCSLRRDNALTTGVVRATRRPPPASAAAGRRRRSGPRAGAGATGRCSAPAAAAHATRNHQATRAARPFLMSRCAWWPSSCARMTSISSSV